jgi:hypothetical protein
MLTHTRADTHTHTYTQHTHTPLLSTHAVRIDAHHPADDVDRNISAVIAATRTRVKQHTHPPDPPPARGAIQIPFLSWTCPKQKQPHACPMLCACAHALCFCIVVVDVASCCACQISFNVGVWKRELEKRLPGCNTYCFC